MPSINTKQRKNLRLVFSSEGKKSPCRLLRQLPYQPNPTKAQSFGSSIFWKLDLLNVRSQKPNIVSPAACRSLRAGSLPGSRHPPPPSPGSASRPGRPGCRSRSRPAGSHPGRSKCRKPGKNRFLFSTRWEKLMASRAHSWLMMAPQKLQINNSSLFLDELHYLGSSGGTEDGTMLQLATMVVGCGNT